MGLAAIQIAKLLYHDIKIIATAGNCYLVNIPELQNLLFGKKKKKKKKGSEEKLAVCKRYGADVAVNYKTTDFVPEVLSATGNKGWSCFKAWVVPCTEARVVPCTKAQMALVPLYQGLYDSSPRYKS